MTAGYQTQKWLICNEKMRRLNENDVNEIGTQLHISLSESARILVENHGCSIQFLETLAYK